MYKKTYQFYKDGKNLNLPYKMKSNYMVEPFGLITSMTLDLQENKEENQIFEEE